MRMVTGWMEMGHLAEKIDYIITSPQEECEVLR